MIAAQLPDVPKVTKRVEGEVDRVRREMTKLVADMTRWTILEGRPAELWKKEREEHRGWAKLVSRAWRAVVKGRVHTINNTHL